MNPRELLLYWRVIKRWSWLIALLVGTTLGAVLLFSFLSEPRYRASASFEVTAPLPAEVSLFSEYRTATTAEEIDRTQSGFLSVLNSEFVVGQALTDLDLDMEAEDLLKHIVVEPDPQSAFVDLSVTAGDPEVAADIANALLNRASRYFAELSAGTTTANKEFIRQQLQETKAELATAREALAQFQVVNRVGSMPTLLRDLESLILDLKARHDEALVEGRADAAATYEQVIALREQELQDLIWLSAEWEDLDEDVSRLKALYSTLLSKESEAELKENEILSARFIRLVPARVPSRPLPRVDLKILLLGGFVSLALGLVLAFVIEWFESAALAIRSESAVGPHAARTRDQETGLAGETS